MSAHGSPQGLESREADAHEELLHQFLTRSGDQMSTALQAMLTLQRTLIGKVEGLEDEIRELESNLEERPGAEFSTTKYDAIAEHLRIMCPRSVDGAPDETEDSWEYMRRASEGVPWLRPLIKNGVFEPTHFVDAPTKNEELMLIDSRAKFAGINADKRDSHLESSSTAANTPIR